MHWAGGKNAAPTLESLGGRQECRPLKFGITAKMPILLWNNCRGGIFAARDLVTNSHFENQKSNVLVRAQEKSGLCEHSRFDSLNCPQDRCCPDRLYP